MEDCPRTVFHLRCVCNQTATLLLPAASGWEGEVVAEAVLRSKAALGIGPDTVVEARLSRLELRGPGRKLKVWQLLVRVSPCSVCRACVRANASSYR